MRSLVSLTLGTLALAGGVYAQSLAEHAAAASGAVIGTAAGKPIANSLTNIFGQVDQSTATAAKTGEKGKAVKVTIPATEKDKAATQNRAGGPGAFSPGFVSSGSAPAAAEDDYSSRRSSGSRRHAPAPLTAAATPVVIPAVVPEPVKEPTLEEVASVKLGTNQHDLFAALGKPESHVIVPDDDGHLRESCQFWAKGRQLGTIRLDNGQVVKVDVRAE